MMETIRRYLKECCDSVRDRINSLFSVCVPGVVLDDGGDDTVPIVQVHTKFQSRLPWSLIG